MILLTMYRCSVEQCNEYLLVLGSKPLVGIIRVFVKHIILKKIGAELSAPCFLCSGSRSNHRLYGELFLGIRLPAAQHRRAVPMCSSYVKATIILSYKDSEISTADFSTAFRISFIKGELVNKRKLFTISISGNDIFARLLTHHTSSPV